MENRSIYDQYLIFAILARVGIIQDIQVLVDIPHSTLVKSSQKLNYDF